MRSVLCGSNLLVGTLGQEEQAIFLYALGIDLSSGLDTPRVNFLLIVEYLCRFFRLFRCKNLCPLLPILRLHSVWVAIVPCQNLLRYFCRKWMQFYLGNLLRFTGTAPEFFWGVHSNINFLSSFLRSSAVSLLSLLISGGAHAERAPMPSLSIPFPFAATPPMCEHLLTIRVQGRTSKFFTYFI